MINENLFARMQMSLAGYETAVKETVKDLEKMSFVERLWYKDPGIWKNELEAQYNIPNSLGWLDVSEKMQSNVKSLNNFTAELRKFGFRRVIHMGMGGSSLAPLAFQRTFPETGNGLPLTVLDSTDPAAVLEIERETSLMQTFFIEASKSGSTVESRSLGEYFFAKMKQLKGEWAGDNFCVITDPGSILAELSVQRRYRRTFLNFSDIGGRYSALSYFGLLPAALMGIDVSELLARAKFMMSACGPDVPIEENPGVVAGSAMGALARRGRDKVTFLMPDSIRALGMWLEQLIAESTGKEGKGILPIAGEPLGPAAAYGEDRFFVYFRLQDEVDETLDRVAEDLKSAGHPLITILMQDRFDIAQEFFRWEIATATAGAILGINPFDQPNVQESKRLTNELLDDMNDMGSISHESPLVVERPLEIYSDERFGRASEVLASFFAGAPEGAFVSILAYLTENAETEKLLQSIRSNLRNRLHRATTVGYGPRYLHSTGQFHKGGPNTGLFLELTADDGEDAPVPGRSYTFGALRRAQAFGDLEALRQHGRRVLRVHLGPDILAGLSALQNALAHVSAC
ncbi:MAG: transaldolase [Syntrophobacteraceae bacterium]